MKRRNSFVSNSSSSSFVVLMSTTRYVNEVGNVTIKLLDTDTVKYLRKCGFKPSNARRASEVELGGPDPKQPKSIKGARSLEYSVMCNEDEIIYLLLKRNVSFSGSCHYGHETVLYRKDDKYIYFVPNPGIAIESGFVFSLEEKDYLDLFDQDTLNGKTEIKVSKVKVEKWLEENHPCELEMGL